MAEKQHRTEWHERAGLLTDQAIASQRDDRLGFAQYATALMSLIDLNLAETPVTIAISAPWGSGKTSLARLLEEQLKASPRVPPHTICWFNAWDHVSATDVRAPLAATVARRASNARVFLLRVLRPLPLSLETNRGRNLRVALLSIPLAVFILATLERLGTINVAARNKLGGASAGWLALVAGLPLLTAAINAANPFIGALRKYASRPAGVADKGDVATVRRQLARLLRQVTKSGRKFVIIIDDLDRCPDSVALDVCSTAMQLLAHPGVVIILLGDMEMLEAAATRQIADSGYAPSEAKLRGRQYLEKLIQLRIDLPPPTNRMLNALATPLGPVDTATQGRWKTWVTLETLGALIAVSVIIIVWAVVASFVLRLIERFAGAGTAGVVTLLLLVLWGRIFSLLPARVEKVRREVDEEIGARIEAGDRDAATIAEGVKVPEPGASQSQLGRLVAGMTNWGLVIFGRLAGLDRKYVVNRAHALIARRWTADVTRRAEGGDLHWHALTAAMRSASDVLPSNPRRTKRLLNTIFLQFMLADMRGVLATSRGRAAAVPAEAVTTWAVIVAQWPDLARRVVDAVAGDGVSQQVSLRSLATSDAVNGGDQGLLALLSAAPDIDAHVPTLATMAISADITEPGA